MEPRGLGKELEECSILGEVSSDNVTSDHESWAREPGKGRRLGKRTQQRVIPRQPSVHILIAVHKTETTQALSTKRSNMSFVGGDSKFQNRKALDK